MDKFSYPDSTESSPRSREIEFDNPPPWEDNQQTHTYKVKLMCSYGGKIQPRPHDNQLTYVNGDTKIISVDRAVRFQSLATKLAAVCNGGDPGETSFKYQLPGEDLDALISVTNDEDLEHMMHEYDRLIRMSSKPARLRLFLFTASQGFGSEGSIKSDREMVNPNHNRTESEKSVTATDFLFGSEKVVVAPASPTAVVVTQQIQDSIGIEPQMFVNQQVIQAEPNITPVEIQRQIHEFQRIQISNQEQQQQQIQQIQHQQQLQQQQQQQEAMYRRKSDEGVVETGSYFTPTYAQNPAPPAAIPQTNQQPPIGYWQGSNNIPGNNIYTTTSQNVPKQQQVYMVPAPSQAQAPGTIYHSVMRPAAPQGNQGYYSQVQPGYNVVQPQPPYSSGQQIMAGGGQMGVPPMGNPMYYTVSAEGMMMQQQPPQPQYQGMGQPVSGMTDLRTGPDGKVVVNAAPKVTQSSDSV